MAYHNRTQHIGNVTAKTELRKTATAAKRAPRMPDTFEIHEPTAEEQAETLKQFLTASGAAKKRREDAEAQLAPALEKITEALTDHWSTGSGRRLRQIVWSIYNGRARSSSWATCSPTSTAS